MNHIVRARDPETGHESVLDLTNQTVQMVDPSTGKLVKLDLGPADVHLDTPLANFAVGYFREPENFVADQVMPVISVQKQSDKYYIWDKDDVFQESTAIGTSPGGNVQEVAPRHSNTAYATVQYALKTFLPTEVEQNADNALQLAMRYMRLPLDRLKLARERRVAAAAVLATNYAAAYKVTLGATEKWNGGSASDPIANIHTRMEASLKPITHMAMSERTWHDFQRNAQVQKYIASKTNVRPLASKANPQEFAAILELPEIVIGAEKYKSSATAYSYIWGDDVVLYHLPKQLPPMGQAISFNTFRWQGGAVPGATVDGGFVVRSYFVPNRGPGGGREIVVYHQDAEQFVDDSVSGLIIAAHQ